MNDDELDETERRALDAWATLTPPPGFADRVLATREEPVVRRRRWPLVAGGLAACAAVAAIALIARTPDRSASGTLTADTRTERKLGDRAVAVAEPMASLSWDIASDGDAEIIQRAGDVFYRVDRGGAFVVHTPAGEIRVTGTCFRIEVQPMTKAQQLLLSGTAGAALAAAVVVTVYEGHVVADTHNGSRTELAAGTRATIDSDGRVVAAADRPDAPTAVAIGATLDERRATREELLARSIIQRSELDKLRTRVAELERVRAGHPDNGAEEGRAWHDPSPERLAAWVGECHVRADEPGLDRWQPQKSLGKNDRGLEPSELAPLNAAMTEIHQQWKTLVRALYIEATGDVTGAENLSLDAMRGEIQEKSPPEEHNLILQKLSRERAGLQQPPADLSQTSPLERLMRAHVQLGDQTEAAIAKRLGAERAKAIRGDGWGSRSDWSGCPSSSN